MNRTSLTMAWLATALAATTSAVGLWTTTYRDGAAMIDQAKGADLATLFVAVPLLVLALLRASRGLGAARLVVAAGLAYLVYNYAIYAFQVVVNPLTPGHIAIIGLASWALALEEPNLRAATTDIGERLPRRTTVGFLAVLVVVFAGLWLSQIGGSIASGNLPQSVADLNLPTSAVYTLDLAFVLPLFTVTALLLVRRSAIGRGLAFGCLVFSVLMALSIAAMFFVQAAHGSLDDPSLPVGFGLIAAVAAVLAILATRDPIVTSSRPEYHVTSHQRTTP
jgi:hypothetical protein